MLRAKTLGLSIEELCYLTIGEVVDMCIEQNNDNEEWAYESTMDDIDKLTR